MGKIRTFKRVLYGICQKNILRLRLSLNLIRRDVSKDDNVNLIVSLTSYGDRVNRTLPYSVLSLLRQSRQPDKIIVWLDSINWDDSNIPRKLKKLIKYGVEIRFCDDFKSYKKLIPALDAFPKAKIITADDDMIYPRDFVKKLEEAHLSDPTKIHAYMVHQVKFDESGQMMSYNEWKKYAQSNCGAVNFSTSGGGCLYTKSLLYKDISDSDLFMKLAPKADDVWLFFMSFLAGKKVSVVPSSLNILPFDVFYQKTHSDSSLVESNVGNNMNDLQIGTVMKHYGITDDDLKEHITD